MTEQELKQMFGPTPDAFKHRVSSALTKTEEKHMKRFAFRTAAIIAAVLVGLMAVGYAAFSSQVADFFGRLYGEKVQTRLEQGKTAVLDQTFTLDDVVFTVSEVTCLDHALYGVGSIRTAAGSQDVLIPDDDWSPLDAFGYDVHGGGPVLETPPEGSISIADKARETGGRILCVGYTPARFSVDGGEFLEAETVGFGFYPLHDGTLHVSFEVEDDAAIQAGKSYSMTLDVRICELTPEGERLEDTYQEAAWTVSFEPQQAEEAAAARAQTMQPAASTTVTALPEATEAPTAVPDAAYVLHVPEEYTRTGTLPVYRAEPQDLGAGLDPTVFNQSGIARQDGCTVHFNDEAVLDISPEELLYREYSGTYNVNCDRPDKAPADGAKPTMAHNIAVLLAEDAAAGWPMTGETCTLERTVLTDITLEKAKAAFEQLLSAVGMEGYTCGLALDMSLDRIRTLGGAWNQLAAAGYLSSNYPIYDYAQATSAEEGYLLHYYKLGNGEGQLTGTGFSAAAYVTAKGVVYASMMEAYVPGEKYSTPEKLADPQTILAALPSVIAKEGLVLQADTILSVDLRYEPMRAPERADGMVLSPVWLVRYHDDSSDSLGNIGQMAFNAIDGTVFNTFQD